MAGTYQVETAFTLYNQGRMSLISKLFSKEDLIGAGACPNCWGEQEYDNLARKLIQDKQIDVNNQGSRHAFIKDFVVNHVTGITLQKDDNQFHCPRCDRYYPLV